jgi:hypothetical protein
MAAAILEWGLGRQILATAIAASDQVICPVAMAAGSLAGTTPVLAAPRGPGVESLLRRVDGGSVVASRGVLDGGRPGVSVTAAVDAWVPVEAAPGRSVGVLVVPAAAP